MAGAFGDFHLDLGEALLASYEGINRELWAGLERGEIDIGRLKVERFRLLFEGAGLSVDPEAFSDRFASWLSRGVYPLDGAVELCAWLSARSRLVILSNGIRDVQLARVGGSPLAGFIERIIVSEEAGVGKPDPGIFEYACDRINYHEKGSMLMVGDSLGSDIRGGANFGIDTCWFNPGHRANGTALRPTYEADALSAIPDLLEPH